VTTTTDIPHVEDVLNGLNSTGPAHLVQETVWKTHNGMFLRDGLLQTGPIFVLKGTQPVTASWLFELVFLPVLFQRRGFFVAFYEQKVYQYAPELPLNSTLLGSLTSYLVRSAFLFWEKKISLAKFSDRIYFSSKIQRLAWTDGVNVGQETTEDLPACTFLVEFFGHLVGQNYSYKKAENHYGIIWSGLNRPDVWGVKHDNEADCYDASLMANIKDSFVGGTGLFVLDDDLFALYPNAILHTRYLGLPKIFNFVKVSNIGCSYPFMAGSNGKQIFFYNDVEQNIFSFGRDGIVSIGDAVREEFTSSFRAATVDAASTRVFTNINYSNNEICWNFCNASDSVHFIYNWKIKKWYKYYFRTALSSNAMGIFSLQGQKEVRISDLDPLVAAEDIEATTLIGDLGKSGTIVNDIQAFSYVGTDEVFSLVNTNTDPDATYSKELITGEFFYGDLFSVKETNAITISATANVDIQVYISVKENLGGTDTFVLLGTWNSSLSQGRLTFPKKSGKVFRWKFTFPDNKICNFYGFQEHIYGGKAEQ